MIENIFSTPIYKTIIKNYPKESMIDRCNKYIQEAKPCGTGMSPAELKCKDVYLGDNFNGGQIHDFEEFSSLNSEINKHVKLFLKNFQDDEIFLDRIDVHAQKSWLVKVKDGGAVQPHTHPNGHLSCVFYIDVPEDAGELGFLVPPAHPVLSLPLPLDPDNYHITPENGMLVIFPSTLWHYVSCSMPSIPRYSVSYDLVCTTRLPEENFCLDPSSWKKLK